MDNQLFLTEIGASFKKFLETGSRSNEKLKILHGAIAEDLRQRLGIGYTVCSLGIGTGKEATMKGRYIDKVVDITIMRACKPVAGIGVKFVMQNYSQNSNNYFENMLGETANIRCANLPYFQIFIIPDKMPYYDKKGNIQKWEEFTEHNCKKYLTLSSDDIQTAIHTPTKTLLFVVHLPDITAKVYNKYDYIFYYEHLTEFEVKKSDVQYGKFASAVIFNDYEDFAEKVVHYIRFL